MTNDPSAQGAAERATAESRAFPAIGDGVLVLAERVAV